jgi:hypothetical protein
VKKRLAFEGTRRKLIPGEGGTSNRRVVLPNTAHGQLHSPKPLDLIRHVRQYSWT